MDDSALLRSFTPLQRVWAENANGCNLENKAAVPTADEPDF
jgi:hypothetical protein